MKINQNRSKVSQNDMCNNSTIPKGWKEKHLLQLHNKIEQKVFGERFLKLNYIIGRYNLVKNDGFVEHYQKIYTD